MSLVTQFVFYFLATIVALSLLNYCSKRWKAVGKVDFIKSCLRLAIVLMILASIFAQWFIVDAILIKIGGSGFSGSSIVIWSGALALSLALIYSGRALFDNE